MRRNLLRGTYAGAALAADAGDIKVFSVQNDFSSGLFNFGVRHHF